MITEISDFMRLLFSRIGTRHCPQCGRAVKPHTTEQLSEQLLKLLPGSRFSVNGSEQELSRVDTGRTVYILDEPTTGLHFADIQKLLDVLHRLTDAGNTVIVIEHNLAVIKTADWIIDLGPEGGQEGGYIIAQGRPEDVAQVGESYTGQFLRQVPAG